MERCKSLKTNNLFTVTFEEPIGHLAAETYTRGEFEERAAYTVFQDNGNSFDKTCVVDKIFMKLDTDSDKEISIKDEFTPSALNILSTSYKLGSLKSQKIGSSHDDTTTRRRLAHIPNSVADPNVNCEACVGTYEGIEVAAPKTFCLAAGCVNGNPTVALPYCNNDKENMVYKGSDCELIGDPNNNDDDDNRAEPHFWIEGDAHVDGYPLYKGTVVGVDISLCQLPAASTSPSIHNIEVILTNAVAQPDKSIASIFPHLRRFTWSGSRQGVDSIGAGAGTDTWNMQQTGVGPTKWGLTIEQFQMFVDACKKEPLWDMIKTGSRQPGSIGYDKFKAHDIVTGYDIDKYFVKPWTKNTGEGVALNFNTDAPKEAEVMISHAWGEDMEQVAEMLSELAGRPGSKLKKSTVIWFCIFSNYQAGGFDEPFAENSLSRTDTQRLGPSVSAQVAMDPFEKVIELSTVHQMYSLQVAELDLYTRLWCILELDTALKRNKEVVLVTSERYERKHLPDLLHADAAHRNAKWADLRPKSAEASAGFLRDVITIVQKLLGLDPDTTIDDPLRLAYYNNPDGTLNMATKESMYMEVNKVLWLNQDTAKWNTDATARQRDIWSKWSVWWDSKKTETRWSCINDNIELWRKAQFNATLTRMSAPLSLPWLLKENEVTSDGDHTKSIPNNQKGFFVNLPRPNGLTNCP